MLALDRALRTRVARLMFAGFEIGKFGGNWVDGHEMTLVECCESVLPTTLCSN